MRSWHQRGTETPAVCRDAHTGSLEALHPSLGSLCRLLSPSPLSLTIHLPFTWATWSRSKVSYARCAMQAAHPCSTGGTCASFLQPGSARAGLPCSKCSPVPPSGNLPAVLTLQVSGVKVSPQATVSLRLQGKHLSSLRGLPEAPLSRLEVKGAEASHPPLKAE